MSLVPFWFIVIAILWTGFLVLKGRHQHDRAAVDGNEVWLIVAGAGMFAAFPGWYATMFSAL